MSSLEKEIQKCRILSFTQVRATGSVHGDHPYRCLWDICGKPMIQWALEPATQCKYIDKVVVCTEDRKIRDVVEGLGVMVIDRPLHQARDFPRDYSSGTFRRFHTRSLMAQIPTVYTETMEYVLYWLDKQQGYAPDIVVQFYANMPLGTLSALNKVIEAFFEDDEATSVRTFYPIPHPLWIDNPFAGYKIPLFDHVPLDRQLYLPVYSVGSFNLRGHPRRIPYRSKKVVGVPIDPEEGLDVHTEEDLFLARCCMKRRLIKAGKEVRWEIGQDDLYENTKEGSK